MGIEEKNKEVITGILSVLFPKAKIYLFGSRARGVYGPHSDIDLAIDEGKAIEPLRRVGEAREVLNALYIPYKIDVVDLHGVSKAMQENILHEGVLWQA
jgi:uncharacterized protein